MAADGREGADAFWSAVERGDPLFASAQTQLEMIRQPTPANVLVNGDFEAGNLDGWEVSGEIAVTADPSAAGGSAARASGKGSLTLTQMVPVRLGERYRLTVRARYEQPSAAALSTDVRFKGKGKPKHEPNYRRLRNPGPPNQWKTLRTTFTVPALADTAMISITSSGSATWLDDLTLERVQGGAAIEPGVVVDDFSGELVDEAVWMEATAGRSGTLPAVDDGALVFDRQPMATLVSLASFDDMLNGDGERRYRLRLHVFPGDDKTRDGFLECGIATDTVSLHTDDSGFYLAYGYCVPGERKNGSVSLWPSAEIKTYWHQDGTYVGGSNFNVPLRRPIYDVWYTVYFGRESVTIFAGHSGYDESAEARIGDYEHGMTDISSRGPVFLKLSGSNVRLKDVSLMRPVPDRAVQ